MSALGQPPQVLLWAVDSWRRKTPINPTGKQPKGRAFGAALVFLPALAFRHYLGVAVLPWSGLQHLLSAATAPTGWLFSGLRR